MSHTTDSMTFEIFVGIFFYSLCSHYYRSKANLPVRSWRALLKRRHCFASCRRTVHIQRRVSVNRFLPSPPRRLIHHKRLTATVVWWRRISQARFVTGLPGSVVEHFLIYQTFSHVIYISLLYSSLFHHNR